LFKVISNPSPPGFGEKERSVAAMATSIVILLVIDFMIYVFLLRNKRNCGLQICQYKRSITGSGIKIPLTNGVTGLIRGGKNVICLPKDLKKNKISFVNPGYLKHNL
jgi:hypothetical protein